MKHNELFRINNYSVIVSLKNGKFAIRYEDAHDDDMYYYYERSQDGIKELCEDLKEFTYTKKTKYRPKFSLDTQPLKILLLNELKEI